MNKKEEIADLISRERYGKPIRDCIDGGGDSCWSYGLAEAILKIMKISEDQSLPKIPPLTNPIHPHLAWKDKVNFMKGMEYLQEKGWVRMVEK